MNTEPTPSAVSDSSVPSAPASTSPPPVRKRWRWILWLVVICILAGGGILLSQRSQSGGSVSGGGQGKGGRGGRGGGGAIPVSVAKVQKGNMGEYIEALGTVTSVYTVPVTSRVAGALTEIHYTEGQMVHKGQLLAVIDPRPYQATYVQAEGQLDRDKASLANARIDLQRYQTAFSTHAVPEQTVATQQATVQQGEGTVKLDEGNLQAAKVNLDYTQIASPIDGRVGLRQTDLGNIVASNGTTPIVTITQLQPITVIFNMAEDFIYDVESQMRAGHKLRVDALDRDDETELAQGTVLTVDNQVDTTTGTVKVRATFTNRDFKLFPNEFVNAKLLVKTLMGVNIIPNASIQRNNDVAYVYVVNASANTVQSRDVNIATTDGTNSAVTGVAPGEALVTDGFDKLQDGAKIVVRQGQPGAGASPGSRHAANGSQTTATRLTSPNTNSARQNPQSGNNK